MNYFQLLTRLYAIYKNNRGKTLTSLEIVRRIKRAVNSSDIKVKGIDSISILGNRFDISGIYESELDFDGKPPIGIELLFPSHKTAFLLDESDLTENHWLMMSIDVASVIGHEYIHMKQARRRHFNECRSYKSNSKNLALREQQEYYGNSDEVDAYAYTLAVALINQIAFENRKKISITKTQMYKIYRHYFGKDSEIVKRLIKKSKTYYRHLEREYYDFYNENGIFRRIE